jgi:hypothetical protein
MADDRDWRRTRDRGEGYGDPLWRRDEERGRYGHGGQDRDERRRAETERDWGRDRGEYGRGYGAREDWARRSWEQDRGYAPRGRSGREGWGRENWDRRYGPDYGPGAEIGRRPLGGSAPGGAWGFDESWGRDPGWNEGWEPTGYGRAGYGRDRYGERVGYGDRGRGDRSWWDRATDEVSSWMGDEEAERRRQQDRRPEEYFRGRGPRGYVRSDERIREDVSDRLTDNPILDATDIDVTVSGGEVTLSGNVDSRYSKRLAEDLADEVSGVRHVQNNLRIRQTENQRESISGTYSGIAESGTTSDTGQLDRSGVSGSEGTGNTSGAPTGSAEARGQGSRKP